MLNFVAIFWHFVAAIVRFVQDALAELDGNIDNVKHTHQRRTFERYLLYLEDSSIFFTGKRGLETHCRWEVITDDSHAVSHPRRNPKYPSPSGEC